MEKWEKQYKHQGERENPSFSSTLLDAIYRSIDESNGDEAEEELIFYRETMRRKHGDNHINGYKDHELGKKKQKKQKEEEIVSLHRACMIERWMEEKKKVVSSYEKVAAFRRKSMAATDSSDRKEFDSVLLNSSSTSSESSCGGSGFSSSESESIYGRNSSAKHAKPIRTGFSSWPNLDQEMDMYRKNSGGAEKTRKGDQANYTNSFVKTKSKALKIYGDLKKVKQPISPGGKLVTFLNSLFTAGHAKKPKISSSKSDIHQLQEESITTPCSSGSSFSRSCLSKTPSSRGKLSSNGAKRSVRFYPVSVIVDEDSRPCGHKTLYGNQEAVGAINVVLDPTDEELKLHVMDQNRRVVQEVARDLLKKYQKKKKKKKDQDFDMGDSCNGNGVCSEVKNELNYDDDEDIASCASSDLFELDNLSAIEIDHRYSEELPVYETTHLGTNLAIANRLIM